MSRISALFHRYQCTPRLLSQDCRYSLYDITRHLTTSNTQRQVQVCMTLLQTVANMHSRSSQTVTYVLHTDNYYTCTCSTFAEELYVHTYNYVATTYVDGGHAQARTCHLIHARPGNQKSNVMY